MSVLPPGPLRIVALVITVAVTWIVVSILLGGLGFPRIQQLFASECGTFPHPATRVAGGRHPDLRAEALRTGLAVVWFVCFLLAGHQELSSLVCLLVSDTV